jgi:phosphoserine/homoserine phosphotransferase
VQVICLDLEGVLVPEIWIEFSKRTGIAAFARTTRDEPDYGKLMRERIGLLEQHGLKLPDIQRVVAAMQPMDGARAFLDDLRARFQVIILSDTFYEFADPLMQQLGRPTLFCHRLLADDDERIVDYKLRQPDQKRHAVNALKGLNFQVMAAGDSYNDTGMLSAAHAGFFIHPPEAITRQFPQFPVTRSYAELTAAFDAASARLAAETQ